MKLIIEVDGVGELVELFDIFKNHFFAQDVKVNVAPHYSDEHLPFEEKPLLRKDGKPFTNTTEDIDVKKG